MIARYSATSSSFLSESSARSNRRGVEVDHQVGVEERDRLVDALDGAIVLAFLRVDLGHEDERIRPIRIDRDGVLEDLGRLQVRPVLYDGDGLAVQVDVGLLPEWRDLDVVDGPALDRMVEVQRGGRIIFEAEGRVPRQAMCQRVRGVLGDRRLSGLHRSLVLG